MAFDFDALQIPMAYPPLIFSLLAGISGILLLLFLRKKLKQKKIKGYLPDAFIVFLTLYVIGISISAVGDVIYWYLDVFTDIENLFITVADIPWVTAYFFTIPAFIYCWYNLSFAEHKDWISILLLIGVLAAVVSLYYLINMIHPMQEGETLLQIAMDFAYPVLDMISLIVVLPMFTFFYMTVKFYKKPILYILFGVLTGVIADFGYNYYSWNEIYGFFGFFMDSLYLFYYIFPLLAFLNLYKEVKKA